MSDLFDHVLTPDEAEDDALRELENDRLEEEACKAANEYDRLYGGTSRPSLFQDMVQALRPAVALLKDDVLAKQRLGSLGATGVSYGLDEIVDRNLHYELIRDLRALGDLYMWKYQQVFGPILTLVGPGRMSLEQPYVLTFDWDCLSEGLPDLDVDDDFVWSDSAFEHAASAYRRACGWDFPPGNAGAWITYFVPSEAWGWDDEARYSGNLVGFLVVYDRDEDGAYDTIAHLWVADGVRRKGVARALIMEARRRFQIRGVEGPLTEDGHSCMKQVWPEYEEV